MARSSDALRGPFPDQVSRTQRHEDDHDRERDMREMLHWSANPHRKRRTCPAMLWECRFSAASKPLRRTQGACTPATMGSSTNDGCS